MSWPLAAGLGRLACEASGVVTLDAMERLVWERGRELLRGLIQLGLDTQAEREVRVPQVTGQDGVPRTRAERGHARTIVTRLGAVVVRRIGYRSGVRGAGSLFPRDAVLNLPPCGYSWDLQQLAVMFCRSGSYEQGTSSCTRRRGYRSASGSWSRSSSPRPPMRSGSARTGTGTGPPSRGRGAGAGAGPAAAGAVR